MVEMVTPFMSEPTPNASNMARRVCASSASADVLPSAIPANAIAQMLFLQCLAEDLLLCVDAGQNRTVGRRYPLRGEFGYAHGHALRLFRIAGVYGLCDLGPCSRPDCSTR